MLTSDDGTVQGCFVGFAETWWRTSGHLWWKRVTGPVEQTLEFWQYLHGEFAEVFLSSDPDMQDALNQLELGRWADYYDESDRPFAYAVEWLPTDKSREDAQLTFWQAVQTNCDVS